MAVVGKDWCMTVVKLYQALLLSGLALAELCTVHT